MLKSGLPVLLIVLVLFCPLPDGLPINAWRYFALFAGLLLALILEPLPNAAIGLIGVVAVLCYCAVDALSAEQLALPGFNSPARALDWALSGMRNSAVWLAFAAFMFGLGYEKTGHRSKDCTDDCSADGRSGTSTWLCGSAGRHNSCPLHAMEYGAQRRNGLSDHSQPAAVVRLGAQLRKFGRFGRYLMSVAFSTSCVKSSLFLTALAPNLIATDLIRNTLKVDIPWLDWFMVAASFGVPLLLLIPYLSIRMVPSGARASPAIPGWAASELALMGRPSNKELMFAALVLIALGLWIAGGRFVHPTTVGLAVMAAMLAVRVLSWEEMIGHRPAWDMLIRLATLVTLADGLGSTGFIRWFAIGFASQLAGLHPLLVMAALVGCYFVAHYLFATTTAHATAVMPVMLGVAVAIPGLPVLPFAMLLAFSHGLMGVVSPYATGPAPVYHGSGYLPGPVFLAPGRTLWLVVSCSSFGIRHAGVFKVLVSLSLTP